MLVKTRFSKQRNFYFSILTMSVRKKVFFSMKSVSLHNFFILSTKAIFLNPLWYRNNTFFEWRWNVCTGYENISHFSIAYSKFLNKSSKFIFSLLESSVLIMQRFSGMTSFMYVNFYKNQNIALSFYCDPKQYRVILT